MTDCAKYHVLHKSPTGKFVLTTTLAKDFLNLSDNDSILVVSNGDGTAHIWPFNPLQSVPLQLSEQIKDASVNS